MKTRSTAVTLESGSVVLTFFFAILLFAVTNSLDAATLTVKVGYPSPSGAQLPVWVIPEAGIDQRYGLNVQLIFISGPSRLTQTLVAGDVDLSTTGGAGVAGVLSGADLFYAAMALLRQYGMQVGQETKLLYLGGVREVLAALDRGIVPAGVLSAPTTLLARRLGYKELINIGSLKLPYVHNAIVARRSLTRQNPELIEEAYQAYGPLFPKVPYMTEELIRSVLLVSDHPRAAKADPKEFFDNRFLKELEETGFIQELYTRR